MIQRPFLALYEMDEVPSGAEVDPTFEFPPQIPTLSAERFPYWPFGQELPSEREPSLRVRFRRQNRTEWTGVFGGSFPPPSATCITTLPDARRAAVVLRGEGTVIDVEEPARSTAIPLGMILMVVPLVPQELMVFGDQRSLCAYGKAGLLWETIDFIVDDVEVGEVVDNELRVRCWSIWSDEHTVAIDLASGKVRPDPV